MFALLADLLTLSRVAAAAVLVWLGVAFGPEKLPLAVLVTVLAWTTDQLDGWAARRSTTPTRLGRHDFLIDATLYAGLLAYLVVAGFLPPLPTLVCAGVCTAVWLVIRRKAVAILGLRIIDVAGGVILFIHVPWIGFLVLAWLAVLAMIYRRRLAARGPRWVGELLRLAGWGRRA